MRMDCYLDLQSAARGVAGRPRAATALGVFDGLHRGHQRLLAELRSWASASGWEPAVCTFDRHPQEVLTGSGPRRILSLEHRLVLLARAGIARVLVLPFDRALSLWSPQRFVEEILVRALGSAGLLMGFDTAFGKDRAGTFERLAPQGAALGIELRKAGVELLGGERVSSTEVRRAIEVGDLARLESLLGRPFALLGRVMHGDGRGARLGFPTANLDVGGAALPPRGVYFGRARLIPEVAQEGLSPGCEIDPLEGSEDVGAVVNIGVRPTFTPAGPSSVEVVEAHLVDWSGDLYERRVELVLERRHREEQRFPSVKALVEAIQEDLGTFRAQRSATLR